jgi:hypothetical protein
MRTVNNLIHTSVEDCKTSLNFIDDLDLLRALLAECEKRGHTSRAKVVAARIRKVERERERAKTEPL